MHFSEKAHLRTDVSIRMYGGAKCNAIECNIACIEWNHLKILFLVFLSYFGSTAAAAA